MILAKVELVELTVKTVVIETINDLSREGEKTPERGRFALSDVKFVEKIVRRAPTVSCDAGPNKGKR